MRGKKRDTATHVVNRATSRGFMVPIVAGAVVILIAMMLINAIAPNINRELMERERIQTQLERKRAGQKAIRSAKVTEVATALLDLGYWAVLALGGGFALWNGAMLAERRIQTANTERYKVAGNGRYLIDTNTSETFDMQSGAVLMNESTLPKLAVHAQLERVDRLNDGSRWTSGKAKVALGAYQQYGLTEGASRRTDEPLQIEVIPDGYEIELASGTQDLMSYSDRYTWVLGQSQATGELSEFTVKDDCNLLVCGAKGQGKTQLALMLMAYARTNNFHTVVADGKGGLDFRKYNDAGLIEWFPIDETNMWNFVVQLEQEFKRREALLSDARCDELDTYVNQTGESLDRILVIIEEFGGTIESIRAMDSKLAKSIVGTLGSILKRARATGIHVALLDQTITGDVYNNSIKANLKYVTYKLPGQQYRVLDVPKDVKLLNRGEFIDYEASEEQKFLTFYTEAEADLMKLPKQGADSVFDLVTGSKVCPQKSGYSTETGYGNQFDNQSTGYDNQPITTHNQPDNQPITTYLGIDWAKYSRLSGKTRNQVLIDELPKLNGPAETPEEEQYALDAYVNLPSKNATYFAVWGGKNDDRMQWLQDVIDGQKSSVLHSPDCPE